jgi:hypothetical protein
MRSLPGTGPSLTEWLSAFPGRTCIDSIRPAADRLVTVSCSFSGIKATRSFCRQPKTRIRLYISGAEGPYPSLRAVTANAYTYGRQVYSVRLGPHTSAAPSRIDRLAPWHGLHEYETHRVPVGVLTLDAKYCELCGCNFLRIVRSKNRYCSKCLPKILALNAQKVEKPVSHLIH